MKAIIYQKKGSPNQLQLQELEKPVPGAQEVLVKIHAVSPNAADYRAMQLGMIPKGKVFGSAIAGVVESAGHKIEHFKPGDCVIGDLSGVGFGGFAEYVLAPEKALVHKPEKLTFEEAATLPVAATTALKALRDKGQLQPGQSVLLVGSGGGVGTFAVQLAKYYGAELTAVCSTQNREKASSLGADFVIDYTQEDFTQNGKRYDLIIAINGNYSLLKFRKALNPKGTYVMVGGSLPQIFKSLLFGWLLSVGSKKMKSLSAKSNQQDLAFLAQLMEKQQIQAVIDHRYPFEKTAEAMNYLAQGHARGKTVITIL